MVHDGSILEPNPISGNHFVRLHFLCNPLVRQLIPYYKMARPHHLNNNRDVLYFLYAENIRVSAEIVLTVCLGEVVRDGLVGIWAPDFHLITPP